MKLILAIAAVASALSASQASIEKENGALYQRHDWFALEERAAKGIVHDPLILGAIEAAFGEQKASADLYPLLTGRQAADARTWLAYLEMRRGNYSAAAAHIDASDPAGNDALAA